MRFETSKRIYEFFLSDGETKWEDTFAAKYFQPAIDFVVRTGELMLLAGAFQVAANATDNQAVDVFAYIMLLALSVHIGISWGRFIYFPLLGWKARSCWGGILIIATAIAAVWLLGFIGGQIRGAAKALVPTDIETVSLFQSGILFVS